MNEPLGDAWKWTTLRLEAARLVAEGETTVIGRAKRLNVGKRTLERWEANATFRAKVLELVEAAERRAVNVACSRREWRLRRIQARLNAIQEIVEARSGAAYPSVPGSETGLVAVEVSQSQSRDGVVVQTVRGTIDAALVREERELLKQAAIEAGQWQEEASDDPGDAVAAMKAVEEAARSIRARFGEGGEANPRDALPLLGASGEER